jgi:hypothetical protein
MSDISAQDAFKLGFLARCAEEKLTGDDLESRLQKIAEFNEKSALLGVKVDPQSVNPWAGAGSALYNALQLGIAVPFGASILGGGALGYGLGKVTEPQIDEDEMRAKELAATYKLYADKAKARRKIRQHRLGQSDL